MTLSREQMRAGLTEHVEAENDRDEARVMATYSRSGPVFEDAASDQRYTGDDIVSENYQHLWDGSPNCAARSRAGRSATTPPSSS